MRKIAIVASESGTGKTTTAINLAHGLALCGKKVLVVDCDFRRNVGHVFSIETEKALGELLQYGQAELNEVRKNLFVIDSGGQRLAEAELALATTSNRERRLELALKNLHGCDVVLCDCPPTVGLTTVNAIAYADQVIVPVSMDRIAPAGARQTMELVDEINAMASSRTGLMGFLPTFYDDRARLSRSVLETLQNRFRNEMFRTVIRASSSLREAMTFHQTIYEYSPKSRGAYDYYQLTEEFLSRASV